MRADLIVPDFISVHLCVRYWLLSVVQVTSIVTVIFLECVASCVWYLVKVHSSVIGLGMVSSWTPLCLSSYVIHLRSIPLVVVIITISRAIIIVMTILWIVTLIVVSKTAIVVPISVKVSGRVITTLLSLIHI